MSRPSISVVVALAACRPSPPPAPDAIATEPVVRAAIEPTKGDPADGQCLLDFLDVGTGLAVFIRCKPAGGSVLRILYDGGTVDPKLKRQGRLAYLLENGLGFAPGSTIDHVIQSHPHEDHHGDLIRDNGILENYTVKHVWDPAALHDTIAYNCFLKDVVDNANTNGLIYHPATRCPDFTKLKKKCDGNAIPRWKNKKVSVQPFDAPSRANPTTAAYDIPLGAAGLSATILHADPDVNTRDHANDASIVVKLDLFGVKVLLTGDEEAGRSAKSSTPPSKRSVEQFLLDQHVDLSANIVQVPHHGSETSSSDDFQNAVIIGKGDRSDTYAVISSGPKVWNPTYKTELPTPQIRDAWTKKLKRGRVLSTKLNDKWAPAGGHLCSKHPDKIAPDPATDDTPAGCNNIEFVIANRAKGRKIMSATYWPIGGRIP